MSSGSPGLLRYTLNAPLRSSRRTRRAVWYPKPQPSCAWPSGPASLLCTVAAPTGKNPRPWTRPGSGSSSATPAEHDKDRPCDTPPKVVQNPALVATSSAKGSVIGNGRGYRPCRDGRRSGLWPLAGSSVCSRDCHVDGACCTCRIRSFTLSGGPCRCQCAVMRSRSAEGNVEPK